MIAKSSADTWLDLPGIETQRQRIDVGLREVKMVTQHIASDLPEFAMRTPTFSFDVPNIKLEFAKDAGKKAADAATSIVIGAQAEVQLERGQHARGDSTRGGGPCHMFDCYRGRLQAAREQTVAMFDSPIAQLGESLKTLVTRGVDEAAQEAQALRETLQLVVSERETP